MTVAIKIEKKGLPNHYSVTCPHCQGEQWIAYGLTSPPEKDTMKCNHCDKEFEFFFFISKMTNWHMKVDFDNLRLQLVKSYNSLTKKLNQGIKNAPFDPKMVLSADSIQRDMDALRQHIVSVCCLIPEGGKDVADEVGEFEQFNPETEEDESTEH